jgi:hypothetical protein
MLDKLKNELAAAVALSAPVLLASGYLITWAQLHNLELPTGPVLSALSNVTYMGVALSSLVVLLAVLVAFTMVLVTIRALPFGSDKLATWPPGWAWARSAFGALRVAVREPRAQPKSKGWRP